MIKKLSLSLMFIGILFVGSVYASNFCMNKFFYPAQRVSHEMTQLEDQCQRSIRDANSKRISVTRSRQICSENRKRIMSLKQKYRRGMSDYRICENKYKSYCGYGGQGQRIFGSGCETMFKQKFYPGYW